ncbi:metallophosphoesterase family protein [Dyadobacter tibetensis]|uniref:metallophosphoesterase family protein n=1 Tax=Dyadobacter tibetensis TaxID=1211851 RepID=UPI00047221CE|nr:metallophosphoesterase [Dyadobacter tibetensis]
MIPYYITKRVAPALLIILIGLFYSCEGLFHFSPNEITLKESEKNLNAKNIARIQSQVPNDTLRFIFMGDTQRWYDESSDFIKSANAQPGISFVVHAGDISDFGLATEFKWINDIMKNLKVPYVTVVGNHDLVANGPLVYESMYGPMDYSFEFGDNKFIFVNTNSREYKFNGRVPNLPWLLSELRDNPKNKNAIIMAHAPPFDADFDPSMQENFSKMLANDPNVRFTLYGHQHTFKDGEYYGDGVHYFVTTSMGERGYLLVSSWKEGYKIERVLF